MSQSSADFLRRPAPKRYRLSCYNGYTINQSFFLPMKIPNTKQIYRFLKSTKARVQNQKQRLTPPYTQKTLLTIYSYSKIRQKLITPGHIITSTLTDFTESQKMYTIFREQYIKAIQSLPAPQSHSQPIWPIDLFI